MARIFSRLVRTQQRLFRSKVLPSYLNRSVARTMNRRFCANPMQQQAPFAVMRLTHEAIRWQINLLEEGLISQKNATSKSELAKYANDWKILNRCIDIHARQENEVFFPVLAKLVENLQKDNSMKQRFVKDASVAASFFTQHTVDDEEREAVNAAFESKDKDKIANSLQEWIADHRRHLKDEEDVMMPLTVLTAESVKERGAIVRDIINVDRNEFTKFQFRFVLTQLSNRKQEFFKPESDKSDDVKKQALGSIKMYCLGTRLASDKKEYSLIKPIIKDVLDPLDYEKFKADFEQDGAQ